MGYGKPHPHEATADERLCVRTIHRAQPSQPKNDSFSLRKKDERMAQMTTESAPRGVC